MDIAVAPELSFTAEILGEAVCDLTVAAQWIDSVCDSEMDSVL